VSGEARRRTVNRESIVDAALTIIDADGIAGLSLEAIATRLGVRGPSLYYYFVDKSEILDAVTARVIGDLGVRRPADDWVEWLVDNGVEFQRRVMEHPRAASLLMEHLNPRASEVGFGHGAKLLAAAGVAPELQLLLLEGVQHLVWGSTLRRALDASRSAERESEPAAGHEPLTRQHDEWRELRAARAADPWSTGTGSLERAVRAFIAGVLATSAADSLPTKEGSTKR